jgi:hypothetical protein
MNRYLQSIFVFDVLFPAIVLGIPGLLLLWAFFSFKSLVAARIVDYRDYQNQVQQAAILKAQLKDVLAKEPLLKTVLSGNDVDARLERATAAAAEKYSSDEIERTLCDFPTGSSAIGTSFGAGQQLQLKFFSRWEPLNAAALDWETANPNLVLETLSIEKAATSADFGPSLQSSFSYFIITEN